MQVASCLYSLVFAGSSNTPVFDFLLRDYPHNVIPKAWEQSSIIPKEQLPAPKISDTEADTHLTLITTQSMANSNFKEITSKYWHYPGRSSAPDMKENIIVSCRKPPSLKDMSMSAKISSCQIPRSHLWHKGHFQYHSTLAFCQP